MGRWVRVHGGEHQRLCSCEVRLRPAVVEVWPFLLFARRHGRTGSRRGQCRLMRVLIAACREAGTTGIKENVRCACDPVDLPRVQGLVENLGEFEH